MRYNHICYTSVALCYINGEIKLQECHSFTNYYFNEWQAFIRSLRWAQPATTVSTYAEPTAMRIRLRTNLEVNFPVE